MTYLETLPSTHSLKQLAELSGPFPIKNRQLLLTAERFGFSGRVIEFLKLYPDHEVFHSRSSFLESCRELKDALQAERQNTQGSIPQLKGVYHGYYPADTAHQTRTKGSWRNFFRFD